MKDFPSLINFLICAFVTLSGLYWLREFSQKYEDDKRYIFRSYFYWWLSWVVWTVTWGIIYFTDLERLNRRWVFALSDLNAIFLITLYFNLTRGNKYKPVLALIEFGYLCSVIVAGYSIFWFLLPDRFDHLQEGWGLCLSAVSTLLVGWAFLFRYKTKVVLIIGFVYAFSQPLAFDAILHAEPSAETRSVLEAFKFVLAIFKMFWATAVMIYFTQLPATTENITVESEKSTFLPSLKNSPIPLFLQTFILFGAIIILAFIIAFQEFPETAKNHIIPILTGLSALVAIVTLLGKIFTWLKENVKENEAQSETQKPNS